MARYLQEQIADIPGDGARHQRRGIAFCHISYPLLPVLVILSPFLIGWLPMNFRVLRSDGILLVTAVIWGFAFTAQRAGMDHIGPFFYSGLRFALGALVLLPFWRLNVRRFGEFRTRSIIGSALVAGIFLTLGVSLQQIGLVYTTAGKAGFITGLYVVFVPIFWMMAGNRSHRGGWIGAVLAVVGLYFLSIQGAVAISQGDILVLISALFWALHVLVLARVAPKVPFIPLAVLQYTLCSVVSFLVAFAVEPLSVSQIGEAGIPILYGGAISVGIAYTLQIVGQKEAPPTHAAIILSLEGTFAVVGGYLVLGETLSLREITGCGLMLAGMLISQLTVPRRHIP